MPPYRLDDVDKQLLDLLQENSRYTAIQLAEQTGVSDNTVHNRMQRMEAAGVITEYTTSIDHEQVGLELHFHFSCTARISDRADVAKEALEVPGVLEVTELMTGQENLSIKAVGQKDDNITEIAETLDDLRLEINDENLIRAEHVSHYDYSEFPEFEE